MEVLAVIGAVGSILGIMIGLYALDFYYKEPLFYVDPLRTEIINVDVIREAPLIVSHPDGTPVDGDVSALRFFFWNEGWPPIKKIHILEPIEVYFEDENVKILDSQILRLTRELTLLKISPNTSRQAWT